MLRHSTNAGLKAVIGLIVASAAALFLLNEHRLRGDNDSLRRQIARLEAKNDRLSLLAKEDSLPTLKLPPPSLPINRPPEQPAENLFARLAHGESPPPLTAEQAEAFVNANHRNAASLLAAYRTSHSAALLEEAMKNFPNDPQVAFEAAFRPDASPEDRRQWLNAFKNAAPDNPLANYLSAAEHFQLGHTDEAARDFLEAANKRHFDDYTLERFQADEEAYRSAGYPEAETSLAVTWGLTLPHVRPLRDAGLAMVELAKSYQQNGDETSARSALQMALDMTGYFDGSTGVGGLPLINQLVALKVQAEVLKSMDAGAMVGNIGMTAKERLDQITQQRAAIRELNKQADPYRTQMSPRDWITYNTLTRIFGEMNAMQWLMNKYGQK